MNVLTIADSARLINIHSLHTHGIFTCFSFVKAYSPLVLEVFGLKPGMVTSVTDYGNDDNQLSVHTKQ